MSVVPIPSDDRAVLVGNQIRIVEMTVDGCIVDVARTRAATSGVPLESLLRDAIEIGAKVLSHGQSQAVIDAIAGEIERLIATTSSTTDEIPKAIQERVAELLNQLSNVLAERFDPKRVDSVQSQIRDLVAGAGADQIRSFTRELVDEAGPLHKMNDKLVAQVKVLNDTAQNVLSKVASVSEKLDAKLGIDDARERSTQKGAPFEDVVQIELEAIAGQLGDEVKCVKHDYGSANTQAGDVVVVVNPAHTRSRAVQFVIEVKTGKLTGPKAHAALKDAVENRDAPAGILVFDDVEDAPLGGRRFGCFPGSRYFVVLDSDDLDALALEVAYHQARAAAAASVDGEAGIDAKWLIEQCDGIAKLVEQAREIKNGANAARRGLDKVDSAYEELRTEALVILDEIRAKVA
jgi:hypothetical protein